MTAPETYDGYSKYGPDEAETYDELREHEDLWRFENRFIEDYFAHHRPSRILDIPVGTGRFLHVYPRESEVLGVDISEHMLACASQKLDQLKFPRARLSQGDLFALDSASGYFDAVVCWRLLHLLPEDRLVAALTELRRVLRGSLVAQVYLRGTPWRRFGSRAARAVARVFGRASPQHPLRAPNHIHTYNHRRDVIESAFAAAGLYWRDRHVLGHYYGHTVCVYVLEPQR